MKKTDEELILETLSDLEEGVETLKHRRTVLSQMIEEREHRIAQWKTRLRRKPSAPSSDVPS